MNQRWTDIGFTVELACGKQAYMGTLGEMAQRETAGIYGPDPCAEASYVEDEMSNPGNGCGRTGCGGPGECICAEAEIKNRTNGHITAARKFQVGDLVHIHGGKPWTVAADDTGSPHTLDTEPAYRLIQDETKIIRGYPYGSVLVRYAKESDLVPVA